MRVPGPVKSALRPLKGPVQAGFELLWSSGFAALGHLRPPNAELWSSAGGRRVLVVAPHPDDEVAGCAGAILEHRRHGDRVVVACATDGRRSRAWGTAPEAMAAARRLEAEAAARTLDAELVWLGLPEGEWRPESLESPLRELLARLTPELVYAPSRVDFHPEHEKTARALAAALAHGESEPTVRIYPVQVPLTPTLANLVVPVAGVLGQIREALGCYRTQTGSLRACLRRRRYSARLFRVRGPAEELWQVSSGRYRRLHGDPPSGPPRAFRGLRYYAWSDPLAYLVGQAERRRLSRLD